MKTKLLTFLYSIILIGAIPALPSWSQTYHYQNGLSASGGVSYTSHFDKDYKAFTPAGFTEKSGFSYELAYLNTKLVSDAVAFTYGLSIMSLRRSFETKELNYTMKENSKEAYQFIKSDQVIDQYHIGLSFRWAFFLNKGTHRFFLGPAATLSIPIFHVASISGSTLESDSVEIKDRYFTEKGPYLFVPLEVCAGYQYELNDCSLFRAEAFFQFRAQGLIQKADDKLLSHYFGLRASFFFTND